MTDRGVDDGNQTAAGGRSRLSDSLADMAGLLFDEIALESLLQFVVSLARSTLDAADEASVSVVHAGIFETITATSPAVRDLDQVQYENDRGPCVAGKTGTAENFHDAWFVGYSPQAATAVWMGNVAGEVPMRGIQGINVVGGSFPARIWHTYMTAALAPLPAQPFPPPDPTQIPAPVIVVDGQPRNPNNPPPGGVIVSGPSGSGRQVVTPSSGGQLFAPGPGVQIFAGSGGQIFSSAGGQISAGPGGQPSGSYAVVTPCTTCGH